MSWKARRWCSEGGWLESEIVKGCNLRVYLTAARRACTGTQSRGRASELVTLGRKKPSALGHWDPGARRASPPQVSGLDSHPTSW